MIGEGVGEWGVRWVLLESWKVASLAPSNPALGHIRAHTSSGHGSPGDGSGSGSGGGGGSCSIGGAGGAWAS